MLSPLNTLRAALVGLALAGTAVTAMPAQAQPHVEFGFHVGPGGGGWHVRPGRPDRFCLSDREVRRLVQRHGYRDVRVTGRRGFMVSLRADRGSRHYRITVDACRGRIIDVDRIRRR